MRGKGAKPLGRRRKQGAEDLESRLDALREPYADGPSRRVRRKRSGLVPTLVGLLLLAAVLGAVYLIYATATRGEEAGEPVRVTVVEGETLSDVADKLREAGAIQSATGFRLQARFEGAGTEIKAGEYTFQPDASNGEILRKLTSGEPVPTFTVTIPEGFTLQQTAQRVASRSDIPAGEIAAAARETDYGYAFLEDPEIRTTEGFLFPKKYEFEEGVEASQVVSRMLEQYFIETQSLDYAEARRELGLSEYELVTVASLIEWEASAVEERPKVASVIYNRLAEGMPLQIDATVQYARGEPKERLSLQDLEVDSPYNTYKHPGLPPGPICSPSLESLRAALQPAETEYLYYVLKRDGEKHYFTDDYDEFLAAKEEAGH